MLRLFLVYPTKSSAQRWQLQHILGFKWSPPSKSSQYSCVKYFASLGYSLDLNVNGMRLNSIARLDSRNVLERSNVIQNACCVHFVGRSADRMRTRRVCAHRHNIHVRRNNLYYTLKWNNHTFESYSHKTTLDSIHIVVGRTLNSCAEIRRSVCCCCSLLF